MTDGCAWEHMQDGEHDFAIPEHVRLYGITAEMSHVAPALPVIVGHFVYCMRLQRFETGVGLHFANKLTLKEVSFLFCSLFFVLLMVCVTVIDASVVWTRVAPAAAVTRPHVVCGEARRWASALTFTTSSLVCFVSLICCLVSLSCPPQAQYFCFVVIAFFAFCCS